MIRVQSVTKHYGHTLILQDVSFAMGTGERVGITGASGCGKTTLARCIAGFEDISTGEIHIADHLVQTPKMKLPPSRRTIGFVFQEDYLWPHMTIEKNVEYGLQKLDKPTRHTRVNEILDAFSITDIRHSYPTQISGGQSKRAAIARMLVHRPKVLIMDEPFVNLDTAMKNRVMEYVEKEIRRLNTSLLYISHHDDEIARFADSVYRIENKRLR